MNGPDHPTETLKREAFAWVARLTSGEATAADAAALDRWCAKSRAHQQAFAEAKLLWRIMRPAAHRAAAEGESEGLTMPFAPVRRQLNRRAFLGGAVAASVAALGYLAVRPPLGLWPSLAELESDYRTGTGEQRQIILADHLSLQLNTQTSIALRSVVRNVDRIELISGEAAITTGPSLPKPFMVVAGEGQATVRLATFNVLYLGSTACVTCQDGEVLVESQGAAVTLQPRQQVSYDRSGLGKVVAIEEAVVTAWQEGFLIFRHTPLAAVVDEVNRYRPGRIILMNAALGRHLVFATFRIDRLEEVVPRLQAVFDMKTTNLPGGVVLLS